MIRDCMILALFTVASGALLPPKARAEPSRTFEVRDLATGAPLFRGAEATEAGPDGGVQSTVYFGDQGQIIARERYAPAKDRIAAYSFADTRTGESVEISALGEHTAKVLYRGPDAAEARTEDLPVTDETLHGKGLVPLILRHWDELAGGAVLSCDLIVAERLDSIGFSVRRAAPSSPSDGRLRFEAVASNFVIRLFAPKIAFVFDPDRRFLAYEGPSPLEVGQERHRPVRIVYEAPAR